MHVTKKPLAPVALIVIAGAAYSSLSSAQIVTDGSVGAQVTLNGLDVQIVETLGTRAVIICSTVLRHSIFRQMAR